MIFLGSTFFSDDKAISATPSNTNITSLQLYQGSYHQLHLSSDTEVSEEILNQEYDKRWGVTTIMDVNFSTGSVNAGNIEFAEMYSDYITVKRRESGQTNWMTIIAKEVNSMDDFDFTFYDKFAKNDTEYEYAISLYSDGKESSRNVTKVLSSFDGIFIADKNSIFGTMLNVNGCDTSRNIQTNTLTLMNDRYPTVVSNSVVNYDSGSVEGLFIDIDLCGSMEINKKNSMYLREKLKDLLANRKPLILKIDDGRIWIIKVTGDINDTMDTMPLLRKISFSWVQIGELNMETLYKCGLSDVDSRWW